MSGTFHDYKISLMFNDGMVQGTINNSDKIINLDDIKIIDRHDRFYIFDKDNNLKIFSKQLGNTDKYLVLVKIYPDTKLRFITETNESKKNLDQRNLLDAMNQKQSQSEEIESEKSFKEQQLQKKHNKLERQLEKLQNNSQQTTKQEKQVLNSEKTKEQIIADFERSKRITGMTLVENKDTETTTTSKRETATVPDKAIELFLSVPHNVLWENELRYTILVTDGSGHRYNLDYGDYTGNEIEDANITGQITDPSGEILQNFNGTTNSQGTYFNKFIIPDRSTTIGEYTVSVQVANTFKDGTVVESDASETFFVFGGIDTTGDVAGPEFVSAAFDANTGVLNITFNETVRNTDSSPVDLSKLFLSAPGTENQVSLADATVDTEGNSVTLSITLTEEQRISTLGNSLTPQLDIAEDAVSDFVGNGIAASEDNVITTTGDTASPEFHSAAFDANTGVLDITFNETVRNTDSSPVDLSKLFLSAPGTENQVSLADATVDTEGNSVTLSITLTEEQRISTLGNSLTPQLDIAEDAVSDFVGNGIAASEDNVITTTGDTTDPKFVSAAFDANTGVLNITFNETVRNTDSSPVDLSKLFLSAPDTENQVPLAGATVDTEGNSVTLSITLTEEQKMSTPGNSGTPQLDIAEDAVSDFVGNGIAASENNAITTTEPPV